MSLDPSLPKHLLHLLEKRQKPGRRKEDAGQSKSGVVISSGAKKPAHDRRRGQRRKPTPAKSRKG